MNNVSGEKVLISEVFPEIDGTKHGKVPILRLINRGDRVPKINPHYKFQTHILYHLICWYTGESSMMGSAKNLVLHGHLGAGKTEAVLQFAARLGIPVFEDTGDSARGLQDFIGMYLPGPDGVFFQEAPLIQALKCECAIYLLNEVDKCNPSTLVELHSFLDSWSITNQLNGERYAARTGFRLACTANTAGAGDHLGIYPGTRPMNAATRSRFIWIPVDYIDQESEKAILVAHHVDERIAGEMVTFANLSRKMFLQKELATPISTRHLLTLAFLLRSVGRVNEIGIMGCFENTFMGSLDALQRKKLAATYHDVFGVDYRVEFVKNSA